LLERPTASGLVLRPVGEEEYRGIAGRDLPMVLTDDFSRVIERPFASPAR